MILSLDAMSTELLTTKVALITIGIVTKQIEEINAQIPLEN